MERIHDEEVDTSEATLRTLLGEQRPDWAELPARRVDSTGTTNTLWRLSTPEPDPDIVVRLPRQPGADASIDAEVALLPVLAASPLADLVAVPSVAHEGRPTDDYPLRWAAGPWIEGEDLWSRRREAAADVRLASALAAGVRRMRSLRAMPVGRREPGERGGPFDALVSRLRDWLRDPRWEADRLVDVAAIRRLADQAAELGSEPTDAVFGHGDLIPGNLIVDRAGHLTAIIDWGGAGIGDPAQDLAPAWAVFDRSARAVFRAEVGADDAVWLRGRTIELEHAVGGVLYYRPRNHPLGDVMATTLDRILTDR